LIPAFKDTARKGVEKMLTHVTCKPDVRGTGPPEVLVMPLKADIESQVSGGRAGEDTLTEDRAPSRPG